MAHRERVISGGGGLDDRERGRPIRKDREEGRGESKGLSRGMAIMAGVAIFLAVVGFQTQAYFVQVLGEMMSDGLGAGAWILAAGLTGDALLRQRMRGVLRLPTAAALGLGVLSLGALGLGLAGLLNRWTSVGMPLAGVAAWVIQYCKNRKRIGFTSWRGSIGAWLRGSAGWGALWLAAVPMLAVGATGVSLMPGFLWKPLDPHPYDVLSYHLQIPREWFDAGHIYPLAHNAFCFFPMNQEMHYLMMMHIRGGPWAAMYLAQFISLIIMVLAVWTIRCVVITAMGEDTPYAAGESGESGHARAAGNIAGVMAAGVPWVAMLGAVAYVESSFLFFSAVCCAWAIRGLMMGEHRARNFAMAGIMAGLAAGAKYTAAPMLLAGVPIAVAAAAYCRSIGKRDGLLGGIILFVVCGAAAMSPWLIRNTVWTGNPIFPIGMRVLGHDDFSAAQVERFVTAHSPPAAESAPWERARVFGRAVAADWQWGWLIVPAGGVAAVVLLARRRRAGVFLGVLLVIEFAVWIGFTHLVPRFLTPVIPIAAAAAGVAIVGARRGRRWVIAGGAAVGVMAMVNFVILSGEFSKFAGPDLAATGVKDAWAMVPESLLVLQSPGAKVAVIGNAMAFAFPLPSSCVMYRDIFNVDIPPGVNVVDGWLGKSVEELRKEGYFVVINLSELHRFHLTYFGIPEIPRQWWRENIRDSIILPPLGGADSAAR